MPAPFPTPIGTLQRARAATLAAFLAALALAGPAQPATFTGGLTFTTGSQSLWGPGGSNASFGASGGTGTTIAGIGVGASYSFGASAGTASASLAGAVQASYAEQLAVPGLAQIELDFLGSSGSFATHLGASASLRASVHDVPFFGPWDPCVYCQDWSLDTAASFAPSFGVQRTATDSFGVAGVGPDIGVAAAQVTLNANQTARFTPTALTGTLVATHRDSGATQALPFSLAGLSVLSLDLDQLGFWDFDLVALDVASTFSTTIGAGLSFDLSCCFGAIGTSFPFANISLLNTPSFSLDFGARSLVGAFSIQVVPEPGVLALLSAGLIGLVRLGTPRRDA